MELELVSIKESSQGCRGSGSGGSGRSAAAASLFKWDMITIAQESLRVGAQRGGPL